ncbi:hypothetical protein ACLOJK_013043 [Asimina triloba]
MFDVEPNQRKLLRISNVVHLLKSCTRSSQVSQIHAVMIKTGLDLITFPLSKLLAASITDDISYARSIFNHAPHPNLFIFNTMLRGHSMSENPKEAILLFNVIRARGISLDRFSFISPLKSCAREFALLTGRCIHGIVVKSGFELLLDLRNTLLHFYCVCRRVEDAYKAFDEAPHRRDVVSWNALMGGYLQASQPREVIKLFKQMHLGGSMGSPTTLTTVISASGDMGDPHSMESVHCYCVKNGSCLDLNVVTAIVAMYAKSSCIASARKLFDQVPTKDVVLWNCIIDGYVKRGLMEESFALLRLMKGEDMKPNSASVAGLLSACAASGSLAVGQHVHKHIEDEHLELDAVLGTALLDMYSKCGLIEKAAEVFNEMCSRDVKSWTAMIAGFGLNGQTRNALQLFYEMLEGGIRPNEVTFLAVLSACSHGGLVMEGKKCFESMVQEYRLWPRIEHYGCMIDLLGRAGLLAEAHELIKRLPIATDATAWRALLAACRVHGDAKLGESITTSLMELNEKHPTDSILLSGTYAAAGRWDDAARAMEWEEKNMMRKVAGCSSIEMDG